jgi:hypothetical protein
MRFRSKPIALWTSTISSARAFARCGIRLERYDPVFVLIALNQIVLEETTRDNLDAKTAAFSESMREIGR